MACLHPLYLTITTITFISIFFSKFVFPRSQHEAGSVSMANYGRPNTNNSQFFITSVESSHLDGTNVVFGQVLRGFGVLMEMEKFASDDAVPLQVRNTHMVWSRFVFRIFFFGHFVNKQDMIIENCGEIKSGEAWNYCDSDASLEHLPPFPADWDKQDEDPTVVAFFARDTADSTIIFFVRLQINEAEKILNRIRAAGNYFYDRNMNVESCRKYKKTIRYYNYFADKLGGCLTNGSANELKKILQPLHRCYLLTCLNVAAVELKLMNFKNAKYSCNEVLRCEPRNAKALYRRGQAEMGLKNYDEAVRDLKTAHQLMPTNKKILDEFQRAKEHWRNYHKLQKIVYKNLFQRI